MYVMLTERVCVCLAVLYLHVTAANQVGAVPAVRRSTRCGTKGAASASHVHVGEVSLHVAAGCHSNGVNRCPLLSVAVVIINSAQSCTAINDSHHAPISEYTADVLRKVAISQHNILC